MTRQELKEKVNEAYDRYLDKIDALAVEFGIVPGSVRQVDNDPRTRVAASEAWHKPSCTNRMFSIRNTPRVTEGSMVIVQS